MIAYFGLSCEVNASLGVGSSQTLLDNASEGENVAEGLEDRDSKQRVKKRA